MPALTQQPPPAANTSYTPVRVKLPGYNILPPQVADTIALSDTERKEYNQFIRNTQQLLSP
jgi:hypothetical protein